MSLIRRSTLVASLLLGFAQSTWAGVVDSPLPAPFTQHVFTVPGLPAIGDFRAFFSCTNLHSASVTIGVELFGRSAGGPVNDVAATSLNVAPGATVVFGSNTSSFITVNSLIGAQADGSARIVATSKKIACHAFVMDPLTNPTSGWQLTIIAKTKQKAEN